MRPRIILTQADALAIPLPDNSVHCMVTSPPYWALRDYGTAKWEGGDPNCPHIKGSYRHDEGESTFDGGPCHGGTKYYMETCGICGAIKTSDPQLGQEPFADCLGWATGDPCGICHVCNLVAVFREIHRVMHPSGVAWLNYGDVYATEAPRGRYGDQGDLSTGDHGELGPRRNLANLPKGVKKGDRLLMAHRVALALQADGWWVRAAPIWHKPNPLPQPAQVYRRPVDSYEMMFMLIKDYRHYFYDAEAVRESRIEPDRPRKFRSKKYTSANRTKSNSDRIGGEYGDFKSYSTRHMRDVWTITTQGWKGSHFATYPERLVEPCIKSTTSEHGVCSKCKAPWRRIVEKGEPVARPDNPNPVKPYTAESGHNNGTGATTLHKMVTTTTTGWEPTCHCDAPTEPALVLDPFVGSGTTCKVARDLGRMSVGLDISLEYLLNEATQRLLTYNGIIPKARKAGQPAPMSDLPLFQGA